jgi:ribonuclease BN (tRNA processing enzyme)
LGYKHEGGLDSQDYLEFSRGADLLFHDAEYKEEEYKQTRSWGHSVYTDALNLALDAGVKKLGLFHHNQERMDDEIDTIVNDCRKIINKSGKNMECSAVGQFMEFKL